MEALQLIVDFLNQRFSDSSHGDAYALLEVVSQPKLKILRDYLEKFPFLSAKRMDYDCWLEGFKIILAGYHGTPRGYNRIDELRAQMNTSRTRYDWSHLDLPNPYY